LAENNFKLVYFGGFENRVTKRWKKCPFISKISKEFPSKKCQAIHIKAQLESPKHLHQTPFGT
jgi:hypothetical protein